MHQANSISLKRERLKAKWPALIFENIIRFDGYFPSHESVYRHIKNKSPYTITIINESLQPEFYRRKEYGKSTRIPITSKYQELLWKAFVDQYGEQTCQKMYAKFLKTYRPYLKKNGNIDEIDDLIFERELEPRYKAQIFKKYRDLEKLKRPRFLLDWERYYNVPEPFTHIDWRNPYDAIFVWSEKGQKVAMRGGSGSSGAREVNSKCIFGFSKINQVLRVPSYLFLYNNKNQLLFIKRFSSLCIPRYDIGSNYHLSQRNEDTLLRGTKLLTWNMLDNIKNITIIER